VEFLANLGQPNSGEVDSQLRATEFERKTGQKGWENQSRCGSASGALTPSNIQGHSSASNERHIEKENSVQNQQGCSEERLP